jgi:hypothetical protein
MVVLNQSHDGIYMVFGLGACGFHRGFGLADPRLPSLEPAVLRERVREWADELERTGESISSTAEFMSNRIRDALEGADGEAAS